MDLPATLVDEPGRKDVLEAGEPGDGEAVLYCERFCACGGVLRIRAHGRDLFGPAGFVSRFERFHYGRGAPHAPVPPERALEVRALVRAAAEVAARGTPDGAGG